MLIDYAAILTSDQFQADSVLQSFNALAAPLGLSSHGPRQNSKTWVQVTRRWQSSYITAHTLSFPRLIVYSSGGSSWA